MGSLLEQVKSEYAAIAAGELSGANADVRSVAEAPDKPAIFREMFRVLKPGGRVAVSDIALKQPLPPEIGQDMLAYVGCIAGAVLIADYERMLREAGFADVKVIDTKKDLGVYAQAGDSGCCSDSCCETSSASDLHEGITSLLSRYDINAYAASVQVYGIKNEPISPITM